MNLSSYFKKSISTGLANTVLSAASTLLFLPLIINRIGVDSYGVWALLAIFTSAAGFADMGVSKSLVYFIPKEKSQAGINNIYSAGLLINAAVVTFLIVVAALLFAADINPWGNVSGIPDGVGDVVTFGGLAILVASLLTSLYRATLEALFKVHVVNIGFFLQTFLYYSTAYVASLLTKDLKILIAASCSVYGVIFFYHVWCMHVYTKIAFVRPAAGTVKKVLGYAFQSLSISILHMIVQPLTRFLFVRSADSSAVYGLFDVALRLSLMAYSLLAAISVPLLSLFSSYDKSRMSEVGRIISRFLLVSAGLYVIGVGAFVLIGEALLSLVFDLDSPDLYNSCIILLAGLGAAGVAEGCARAFMAFGELRLLFIVRLLLPVTNFVLIFALPSMYVLTRFSIAYSAAFLVAAAATVVVFWVTSPGWVDEHK